MIKHIRIAAFFLVYAISSLSFAGDTEEVTKKFRGYWADFSSARLSSVSQYIIPSDLERARNAFMPIFLNLSKSQNPRLRQQADVFFGNIPIELRTKMPPNELYMGLHRIIFSMSPKFLEILKGSTAQIDRIQFTSADEATVYYSVKFPNGSEGQDTEYFKKVDGQWFLRLKNIEETATKLRIAIDKSSVQ